MIKNKIVVVIPAFNEEKTIAKVVDQVKSLVDEVVVVDDGSTDNTYELVKRKGITVLSHLINRGQGAALQTGNQCALDHGAEIVVHFDADGQFLAKEIKDIIKPIESGEAEVVFGSRFLKKKSNIPWFKKYILIPIAHLVNKLTIGFSLTDPQSGFRAMCRKAVENTRIENDGMAHCSEILYKVFKNNLLIKEVPITVIYHDFGQCFGGGVRIVKDLLLAKLMD